MGLMTWDQGVSLLWLPLQVAPTTGKHLKQLAIAGDHNASLDDCVTLRSGEKFKFSRDVMEVGITLGRCAVLCQSLFQGTGPANPLVNIMWKLFADVQNSAPSIVETYQQVVHQPAIANIFHASILRTVQVQMHNYLQAVSVDVADDHTGMDTPDFRLLVTDLKHGTFPTSSHGFPSPWSIGSPPAQGAVVLAVRGHQALSPREAARWPRGAPASRH